MEYITSSFGINIGTGLMLESVLDPTSERVDDNRVAPKRVSLDKYKTWYFNLTSFVNNVVVSYDKVTLEKLFRKDFKTQNLIVERVSLDLEILYNLLGDKINLVFYDINYPKYKDIMNKPNDKTKVGQTTIAVSRIVDLVVTDIITGKISVNNYYRTDNKFVFKSNSLITTSIGLDLIHLDDTVHLLEYHTGVLKKRDTWYTKIKVKDRTPFEEILILAYGDKKGLINSPLTLKEKRYLSYVIMNNKLKSYYRYSKNKIINLTDDELNKKLKTLPLIY